MIRDLVLLIGLQLTVGWNRFWRLKLGRKLLTITLIGFLGACMIFLSAITGLGAGSLLQRYPELKLEAILPKLELEALLPGLILTAIALLLLISSFGLALGSLFFSRDLDILMSAPISRRAVFASKVLGGFTTYYALVFALALPAMITYGIGLNYSPLYYLFMLVAVIGTPLLPAGLGALLVLLVARVAPARRVREVMGLVAALFGSSCALLSNTANYWARNFSGAGVTASFDSLLGTLRSIQLLPVPSLMAGRGLVEAGQGNLLPALGLMAGFLLVTFGFFAGCVFLADRMYATGWLRMQSGSEAKRKPATAASQRAAQRDLLGRAAPFLAIALKDWRIIPRDLRNFAQFLSPLFLIPLIYFQLFVNGGKRGETVAGLANGLANGVDLSSILLTGTVLLSTIFVFSRIAQTGISMEGRSYWILKAAPIAPRDLLLGKFVAAMLPFTVLATLLLVIAAFVRSFSLGGFLYGWFGVMLLGAGMLAMDVGLSVPWANLEWDDPRKMHSGWGGAIALVGYAVIGVVGGFFLALPYVVQVIPFLNTFLTPVAWVVGPFFAIGFTGLAAGLSLWLGLSRFNTIMEA